jgi:hypothetical protein
MDAENLSPNILKCIDILFPAEFRKEASRILMEQCGNNLPLMETADKFELERIRLAALKTSNADIEYLNQAVKLANEDWRDLLVGAGFAHDLSAHLTWLNSLPSARRAQ